MDLLISRSSNHFIGGVSIPDDLLSDHSFVQFHANVRRPPNPKVHCTYRRYNAIDRDELRDQIKSAFDQFSASGPNHMLTSHKEKMVIIKDKVAPENSQIIV